jgi:hypothetical protein
MEVYVHITAKARAIRNRIYMFYVLYSKFFVLLLFYNIVFILQDLHM